MEFHVPFNNNGNIKQEKNFEFISISEIKKNTFGSFSSSQCIFLRQNICIINIHLFHHPILLHSNAKYEFIYYSRIFQNLIV